MAVPETSISYNSNSNSNNNNNNNNKYKEFVGFSICDRATVLIYILKNQLFVLKYTLKHSLIRNKLISTPTCFGPTRPSSGSCRAQLLSYLEQLTFVLCWLGSGAN